MEQKGTLPATAAAPSSWEECRSAGRAFSSGHVMLQYNTLKHTGMLTYKRTHIHMRARTHTHKHTHTHLRPPHPPLPPRGHQQPPRPPPRPAAAPQSPRHPHPRPRPSVLPPVAAAAAAAGRCLLLGACALQERRARAAVGTHGCRAAEHPRMLQGVGPRFATQPAPPIPMLEVAACSNEGGLLPGSCSRQVTRAACTVDGGPAPPRTRHCVAVHCPVERLAA